MRQRFVYDPSQGRVVPADEIVRPDVPRSAFPCPMLATDTMEPVQAMTDGSWHDSKSSIRANYRTHGVIEVGNDPARLRPRQRRKVDRQSIKTTIEKATARFERGERA